ncbi:MAG: hypothetical protein IT320_28225, partial [Anaerolineae bacterium]|nr:hypothetical protein [Anaerolineae bacterium]
MTTLSSDLVIGGSPAVDDIIVLEIARLAADAADTGTAALLLVGVEILYTDAANTDD